MLTCRAHTGATVLRFSCRWGDGMILRWFRDSGIDVLQATKILRHIMDTLGYTGIYIYIYMDIWSMGILRIRWIWMAYPSVWSFLMGRTILKGRTPTLRNPVWPAKMQNHGSKSWFHQHANEELQQEWGYTSSKKDNIFGTEATRNRV